MKFVLPVLVTCAVAAWSLGATETAFAEDGAKWKTADGYRTFVYLGANQWRQTTTDGDSWWYRQIASNPSYVEIHSASGKYKIRLYRTHFKTFFPGESGWTRRNDGAWVEE